MNGKTNSVKAGRLGELDLWKFIFSIVVVALHSSYLPTNTDKTYLIGGSIGVEFFFLVSGFFLAKSAQRAPQDTPLGAATWRFLRKKAAGFLPYLLFGYCVSLISKTLYQGGGPVQLFKNVIFSLSELALLKSAGLGSVFFNGPTWYISAMMLSMLICYPLLLKYRKTFSQLAAPVLAVFILGYLYQKFGHFRSPDAWSVYFNKGFLRGFAEICLGIFCYECSMFLRNYTFRGYIRLICTLFAYGSLCCIIAYTNAEKWWNMDASTILLFAASVIIFGSGNLSLLSRFFGSLKITPYLGKFSLMIYLNHTTGFGSLGS